MSKAVQIAIKYDIEDKALRAELRRRWRKGEAFHAHKLGAPWDAPPLSAADIKEIEKIAKELAGRRAPA